MAKKSISRSVVRAVSSPGAWVIPIIAVSVAFAGVPWWMPTALITWEAAVIFLIVYMDRKGLVS